MSADDAEQAVTRSQEAYLNWRRTSFDARAQLFNNLADLMEERIDDLTSLMTREMGKVAEQGRQEVQLCANICRYTAEHGAEILEDEHRIFEGGRAIISYQPIGVILGIQPWNFPLYQVIRYSVSNIMAGNTTVLKHAKNVFGMAVAIQQMYEDAGFPKNVYQSLLIDGGTADENTDLGPMAREDLRDELHEQVKTSLDAGATLSLGGEVPDNSGYFYPITVLENVSPGMPAYDDELFGPVASLIRVRDDKEAMTVANDSRYGLGGGIFSTDTDNAIALAKNEFDTGMVNINGYSLAQPNLPFGGVKDSGYGREHGGYGMREFVNIKTIMIAEQQNS